MTREEFMQLLGDLARAAESLNEMPAAGVLYALRGSMHAGTDKALCHAAANHCKADLARIKARYHKAILDDDWPDTIPDK